MAGYIPMHKLLNLPEPPTAVFLIHDLIAPGAYEAIVNSNLSVPNDISLIAIAPESMQQTFPVRLTAVRQPSREIGRVAAEMLKKLTSGKSVENKCVKLKANLVLQDSTAPPKY